MTATRWYRQIFLLASFTVAALVAGCSGVTSAPDVDVAGATPSTDTMSEAATSDEISAEGITVHGNWVIEVLEQDGTPVSRHEFENALDTNGSEILAKLLAGERRLGQWGVYLGGTGVGGSGQPVPDAPCHDSTGAVAGCYIIENPATFSAALYAPNYAQNLQTNRVGSTLVLTGSKTADRGGTVDIVSTLVGWCTNFTSSPATCDQPVRAGTGIDNFTTKPLSSSISVLNDQQLNVTVTLSFG